MSEYIIQGETLTAIGDAIRAKTGSTELLTPENMPTAITGISTGFPNGTEWTKSNLQVGYTSRATYADGVWLVMTSIYSLMYSTDGMNWIQTTGTTGITIRNIKYLGKFNGVWLISSEIGIYYSFDGKNWSASNITDTTKKISYTNGIWFSATNTNLIYSTDGKIWSLCDNYTSADGIVYSMRGLYVTSTSGNENLIYSNDGINWVSAIFGGVNTYARSIVYCDNEGLLGFANGGNQNAYYTTDCENWVETNLPVIVRTVLHANGMWLAKSSEDRMYYSVNGINWTPVIADEELFSSVSIIFANGVWVTTDKNNMIVYSIDGINWLSSGETHGSLPIYGAGIWIKGGSEGVYYSTDLIHWEQATDVGLSVFAYGGNVWVGGSGHNSIGIYYSQTWAPPSS